MINIHPALLPAFKGLDTHARALAAGMRIHGCTVHFVTPEMDDGPIIAQAAVPVMVGDNADTLAARVLKAEHQLYPLALGWSPKARRGWKADAPCLQTSDRSSKTARASCHRPVRSATPSISNTWRASRPDVTAIGKRLHKDGGMPIMLA